MTKIKTPWPTKDAMTQIYDKSLWGGDTYDFYSGEGSHDTDIIAPYIDVITTFLSEKHNQLVVCDLGCGDFNVGQHLVNYTKEYKAIDVVAPLIERNKRHYKASNLEFLNLDIVQDNLPAADCVILRQVLQHLSNNEVSQVLKKLNKYRYIILTEHIPTGNFTPNKDIISGQGTRLKHQSGVNVLSAPFLLNIAKAEVLNEFVMDDNKSKIVTLLFDLQAHDTAKI